MPAFHFCRSKEREDLSKESFSPRVGRREEFLAGYADVADRRSEMKLDYGSVQSEVELKKTGSIRA